MAVIFKKYERTESTLTELGTVASHIPGGKLSFTPGSLQKFLAGNIKAISILLIAKNGDSATTPLSKRMSAVVKAALANGASKAECLQAISGLLILETEDGSNIIAAPRGADGEEESITIGARHQPKVTYDDLVAF